VWVSHASLRIIAHEHVRVLMTRGYADVSLLASSGSGVSLAVWNLDDGCFEALRAGGYKWQYILIAAFSSFLSAFSALRMHEMRTTAIHVPVAWASVSLSVCSSRGFTVQISLKGSRGAVWDEDSWGPKGHKTEIQVSSTDSMWPALNHFGCSLYFVYLLRSVVGLRISHFLQRSFARRSAQICSVILWPQKKLPKMPALLLNL